MAHISSLGAGIYTEFAYTSSSVSADSDTQTEYEGFTYTTVSDIREYPTFGTPANVVTVPVFGQSISAQIQAQADAPTLEFTLNYIPANHDTLQGLAGDGVNRAFRFRIANTELPATLVATTEHDDFYVQGQIAAFEVSPSLSDSNTATLTVITSNDFIGPFTTT